MTKKAWRVAFPLDAVEVPKAACFDALRLGALVAIGRAYWNCGCTDESMPRTKDGWQAIARASNRAWPRIQDQVMPAFLEAKPLIRDAHKAAMMTSENGRNAGRASLEQRLQKSRAKSFETPILDKPSHVVPFLPAKAPLGSFGHSGRNNAGQSIPYRAARGLAGTLTDKPTKS